MRSPPGVSSNVARARGSPEKSNTLYIIRGLAFHAVEQIRGNRNQLYSNSFLYIIRGLAFHAVEQIRGNQLYNNSFFRRILITASRFPVLQILPHL
jgi:hypothetical protein